MLFQSYIFAAFLLCVLGLYFAVPAKGRLWVLLLADLVFFGYAAPSTLPWLIFSIISTYVCGILLERQKAARARRGILFLCMAANLALLVLFRYLPVWDGLVNGVFGKGIRRYHLDLAGEWNLLAPLGISFYTLQALGYLFDVSAGKYRAERNPVKYAVFVSFFPNLSSGPIERGDHFLPQLERVCRVRRRELLAASGRAGNDAAVPGGEVPRAAEASYDTFVTGLISILWGFFLKMVLADRAAILVDHLYGLYQNTDSFTMLMAALFYSVQIYCDFASYSFIAVGTAQLMGFSLIQNFRQPYFAAGFKEFWSRWHISLSSWLKDYVYIPLGGNRKGMLRKYRNLLITFLVSGLWHGGAPHFLVWGLLHGALQILEDGSGRIVRRISGLVSGRREGARRPVGMAGGRTLLAGAGRLAGVLFTFAVVTLLWIFFRADSLEMAFACLENLFTRPQGFLYAKEFLFVMGLDRTEFIIAASAAGAVLAADLVSEWKKQPVPVWLYASALPVRFAVCLLLIGSIFVFGKYGTGFDASNFIYMGF